MPIANHAVPQAMQQFHLTNAFPASSSHSIQVSSGQPLPQSAQPQQAGFCTASYQAGFLDAQRMLKTSELEKTHFAFTLILQE